MVASRIWIGSSRCLRTSQAWPRREVEGRRACAACATPSSTCCSLSRASLLQRVWRAQPYLRLDLALRVEVGLVARERNDDVRVALSLQLLDPLLGALEGVLRDRRALELNPERAETWSNLGNLLKDQGDYEGAIKSLDRALELDPELDLALSK